MASHQLFYNMTQKYNYVTHLAVFVQVLCKSSGWTVPSQARLKDIEYDKKEEQTLTSPGLPCLQGHHDVKLQDQLWGRLHEGLK
jgi:hypothetical protein